MLRTNAVRVALAEGRPVYGLFAAIPSPALVEMIGCAGYDFAILDSEHTLVDPQQLENMIRAAEAVGLTPFVRVPEHDPGAILRALDAGAMGIVVPHVRTRDDVDAAVRAARYAPEGMRSLNGGRVPGFGHLDLQEYVVRANAEILVIGMIEDAEAVDDLDAILGAPVDGPAPLRSASGVDGPAPLRSASGVDGPAPLRSASGVDGPAPLRSASGGLDLVLEGAADLSQSYGVPWQTRHPRVRAALGRIADACEAHGVPFCAIPRTPADHEAWRARGVTAFVLGEERSLAARALRGHLADHRAPSS